MTVTASIGWNDGTAQTLSTAAVNFSTGANNPQTLTATIINVADLAFTYSASVSGAWLDWARIAWLSWSRD